MDKGRSKSDEWKKAAMRAYMQRTASNLGSQELLSVKVTLKLKSEI